VGLDEGVSVGIGLGDGEGIAEGLDVGIGVVGDIVGDTVGKAVGKQVSHVNVIHMSIGETPPTVLTLHIETPVGGIFKKSPESSS